MIINNPSPKLCWFCGLLLTALSMILVVVKQGRDIARMPHEKPGSTALADDVQRRTSTILQSQRSGAPTRRTTLRHNSDQENIEAESANETPRSAIPPSAEELIEAFQEPTKHEVRQVMEELFATALEMARGARVVQQDPGSGASVYLFPKIAKRSAIVDTMLAELKNHLASEEALALTNSLEQTSEWDPSADLFRSERRISVLPNGADDGWRVVDQTFSADGAPKATSITYLSMDEDGQLVWPDEYQALLSMNPGG